MEKFIDDLDEKILDELSRDSKVKVKNLAKKLGFPKSTVHNRIKKMENDGIITGYKALIDYEKIGREGIAFINITVTDNDKAALVLKMLIRDPRIEEVYTVTGGADIVAKFRFRNCKEVDSFLFHTGQNSPRSIGGVQKTETEIVLSTFKEFGIPTKSEKFSTDTKHALRQVFKP